MPKKKKKRIQTNSLSLPPKSKGEGKRKKFSALLSFSTIEANAKYKHKKENFYLATNLIEQLQIQQGEWKVTLLS